LGTRIILVDGQVMFRDSVRALLERIGGCEVVGEASDGGEALACIEADKPDLVVLEIGLPVVAGPEVVRRARAAGGSTQFLFLTSRSGKREVEEAFQAGASGFVCKDDPMTDLLAAIETVRKGQTYLSPNPTRHLVELAIGHHAPEGGRSELTRRELEILRLIAEGLSSKEIADQLHVSVRTVDSHRANMMQKLEIRKVSKLVRYAIREGLLEP
jgi:DNA-binding NarL/FixJ family response regulator